jgi:hypothetical protein
MSHESLEKLKAIIDNAPEGATHLDDINTYWKVISEFDYYFHNGSQWDDSEPLENGTRSLSDIERIIELMEVESDIRAALKSGNIQNRKILDKTVSLQEKIKDIGYSYRRVEEERDELRVLKFKKFNEEECWLYQGDGNDYLESLVCPVVISTEKLIDIINGDL